MRALEAAEECRSFPRPPWQRIRRCLWCDEVCYLAPSLDGGSWRLLEFDLTRRPHLDYCALYRLAVAPLPCGIRCPKCGEPCYVREVHGRAGRVIRLADSAFPDHLAVCPEMPDEIYRGRPMERGWPAQAAQRKAAA